MSFINAEGGIGAGTGVAMEGRSYFDPKRSLRWRMHSRQENGDEEKNDDDKEDEYGNEADVRPGLNTSNAVDGISVWSRSNSSVM
jgi:hypothetical protein